MSKLLLIKRPLRSVAACCSVLQCVLHSVLQCELKCALGVVVCCVFVQCSAVQCGTVRCS